MINGRPIRAGKAVFIWDSNARRIMYEDEEKHDQVQNAKIPAPQNLVELYACTRQRRQGTYRSTYFGGHGNEDDGRCLPLAMCFLIYFCRGRRRDPTTQLEEFVLKMDMKKLSL
jgi:hypothetical protein